MYRQITTTSLLGTLLISSLSSWGAEQRPFFPKTHPNPQTQSSQPTQHTSGLSGLVGTWKQVGQDRLFWSIRSDGTFRVHGVFPGQPYRGTLQDLGDTKYRVITPQGNDEITAARQGNRLQTDGRLGKASWLPVWLPTSPAAKNAGDRGACDSIPTQEIANILGATLEAPKGKALKNRRAQEGCKYVSTLSRNDRVELNLVGGPFTFNQARENARQKLPLTNLPYDAFAELDGKTLTAHILRGEVHMRIELRLNPAATAEDLAFLNRLAKIAAERLQPEWV